METYTQTYKIYNHQTGGYRAVKQDFSWPAFFFTWIWAFVKELWIHGVIGLIVGAVLGSLYDTFKESGDMISLGLVILLTLTCSIVFGVFGNRWRMNSLLKRGFEYIDTVSSDDQEAAILQVANRNEDGSGQIQQGEKTKVFDGLRVRNLVVQFGLAIVASTVLREFLLAIGLKPSISDFIFFVFVDVWIFMWILRKLNKSSVNLYEFLGRLPSLSNLTHWTGITVGLYIFAIGSVFLYWRPLSYFAPEYAESLILAYEIDGNFKPLSVLIPQLVLLIITGPFVEELVFRGVILQRWATKWGLPKSIIFSSLIFAIIHEADPIGSFFFGLVMAILFIRTGSLWAPIFCHSLFNAVPFLLKETEYFLTGQVVLASDRWLMSQTWICIICLLVTGPWIVWFIVKNWPRQNCQIPYEIVIAD